MTVKRKSNIDQGYAWVVLAAASLVEIIAGILVCCVGILTTAIVAEIDNNLTRASLVSSVMLGTFSLFGPVAGIIQDTIGHRLTGIISGILMLIGLTAAAFCRSVLGLILTFGLITGLGLGLAVNLSGVAPGNYFEKRLPAAYGICMAGGGIGIYIVGPFTVFLLDLYNLPGTFLILGGVAFHVCLSGALIRPSNQKNLHQEEISFSVEAECSDAEAKMDSRNVSKTMIESENLVHHDISQTCQPMEAEGSCISQTEQVINQTITAAEHLNLRGEHSSDFCIKRRRFSNSVMESLLNVFTVLGTNGFFLYAFSTLFWSLGESACMVHLPNYFEHKGSSSAMSAQVITVMGFTSILSAALAGSAASDTSIEKLLLHIGLQGVSGILNVLLPLYSHTFPLQMLFGALYGLYSQAPYSLIGPICIELVGLSNLAVAYGLSSFALGIGYLIGPPLASLLYEVSGVYDYTFVLTGSCLTVSSLSVAFIPMFKKERREEQFCF